MRTIGAKEQAQLEAAALDLGIPMIVLMEAAARAIADRTLNLHAAARFPRVSVLCGLGNNGGDGFATARLLFGRVPELQVYELALCAERSQGNARINREACVRLGIPLHPLGEYQAGPGLVIDAVFGSGFDAGPEPDAEFVRVCLQVEKARADFQAYVLAVDVPSGVEAASGQVGSSAFCADETLSFIYPKTGLFSFPGAKFAGSVSASDLGLPSLFLDKVWTDLELRTPSVITAGEIMAWRPERARDSHKGSYGRLLIAAGNPGLAGAAVLSGRAALKSGVGYAYLSIPQTIYPAVLEAAPSLLVSTFPEEGEGDLAQRYLDFWQAQMQAKDALLIGPGLGLDAERLPALDGIIRASCKQAARLVLDADALNIIAQPSKLTEYRAILRSRADVGLEAAVLTPHPGEFARLCPEMKAIVSNDRILAARTLAQLSGSVVVLKGAGTVIAFPADSGEAEVWINSSGNAGMAKAGTGDLLSGMLGAFLAQGLPLKEAVLGAVYLHGLAADIQAEKFGQRALTPEDILEGLPLAFAQLGWDK